MLEILLLHGARSYIVRSIPPNVWHGLTPAPEFADLTAGKG